MTDPLDHFVGGLERYVTKMIAFWGLDPLEVSCELRNLADRIEQAHE